MTSTFRSFNSQNPIPTNGKWKIIFKETFRQTNLFHTQFTIELFSMTFSFEFGVSIQKMRTLQLYFIIPFCNLHFIFHVLHILLSFGISYCFETLIIIFFNALKFMLHIFHLNFANIQFGLFSFIEYYCYVTIILPLFATTKTNDVYLWCF